MLTKSYGGYWQEPTDENLKPGALVKTKPRGKGNDPFIGRYYGPASRWIPGDKDPVNIDGMRFEREEIDAVHPQEV